MEIHLPAELEEMLKQKVEAGLYHSVDDAIATALCLLDDWDAEEDTRDVEETRKMIQEAYDSGPAEPMDFEAVKARGRKRLAEERAKQT